MTALDYWREAAQELSSSPPQELSYDDPEQDFYRPQPVDNYFSGESLIRQRFERPEKMPWDDEVAREATRAEPPKRKASQFRRFVADPLISLEKGLIGIPEAAVGLMDMQYGGLPGYALEKAGVDFKGAKEYFSDLYSPEQQEAYQRVAGAEGFWDTFREIASNPSVIGHSVVESLPLMVGGAGVARGLLKAAPTIAPYLAGAFGEGVVSAGSAAERIRQSSEGGLLSPKQSLAAAGSGAATGLLGAVGGRLAQKLGATDVDTLLAAGASTASKEKILRRLAKSALLEGTVEELPQSAQEQISQNLALDKPWDEGVAEAAILGWFSGSAVGGAAGGFSGIVDQRERRNRLRDLKVERGTDERASRLSDRRREPEWKAITDEIMQAGFDANGNLINQETGTPTFTTDEIATPRLPKIGDTIEFQEGWPNPRTIRGKVVRLANNPVHGGEPIVPIIQDNSGREQPASEWFSSGKVVPETIPPVEGEVSGKVEPPVVNIEKAAAAPTSEQSETEIPLVPVIITASGEVISGNQGDTHKDIIGRQPLDWKMDNIENLTDENRRFLTNKGNVVTREQAAAMLGENVPLQSERLREIQKKAEVKKEPAPADKISTFKSAPIVPGTEEQSEAGTPQWGGENQTQPVVAQSSIVDLVDWGRQLVAGTTKRGTAKTPAKGKVKTEAEKLSRPTVESVEIQRAPDYFDVTDRADPVQFANLTSDADVSGGIATDTHRITFFEDQETGEVFGLPTYKSTSRGIQVRVAPLPGQKKGQTYGAFTRSGRYVPIASVRLGKGVNAIDPKATWVYEDARAFEDQVSIPGRELSKAAARSYEAAREAMTTQIVTADGDVIEQAQDARVDTAQTPDEAVEELDPIINIILDYAEVDPKTGRRDYSNLKNRATLIFAIEDALKKNRAAFAPKLNELQERILEENDLRSLKPDEVATLAANYVLQDIYEDIVRSADTASGRKISQAPGVPGVGGRGVQSQITETQAPPQDGDAVKVDAIDAALTKAIDSLKFTPEGSYSTPVVGLTKEAMRGALLVVRAAYRGGKAFAEAVQGGVDWLIAQGHKFDPESAREWLSQADSEFARTTARKSVGQLPIVQSIRASLREIRANVEGLFGPLQMRAAGRVLNHPVLKGLFNDVEALDQAIAAQEAEASNLFIYKSDARYGVDTEYTALVGNVASGVVDSIHQLRTRAAELNDDGKIEALTDKLTSLPSKQTFKRDLATVLDVVLSEYKQLLVVGVTSGERTGMVKAFYKAISFSESGRNLLSYLIKEQVDVAQIARQMIANKSTFMAELKGISGVGSLDQLLRAVRANEESINATGEMILQSETLRQMIATGQKVLEGKPNAAEEEFYERLRGYIEKGETRKAVDLFTSKTVEAGIDRRGYLDEASFFLRRERTLLVQIESLKRVREIYDAIVKDPGFRALEKQAYAEINVHAEVDSVGRESFSFMAIPGQIEEVRLSLGSGNDDAYSNMERIRDYDAAAERYMAAPEAPEYNEATARGLRAWREQSSAWTNSGMLPQSGVILQSPLLRLGSYATGRIAEAPYVVFDTLAPGVPRQLLFDTGTALFTAQTVVMGIYQQARTGLNSKTAKAMKVHGLTLDDYRKKVWRPLLKSRQYFEDKKLSVGDKTEYGEVIKREDIELLEARQKFERLVTSRVFGAPGSPSALRRGAVGIRDRGFVRNQVALGPNTLSRHDFIASGWARRWNNGGNHTRIINENADTLLWGYIAGADERKLTFNYTHRSLLKAILKEYVDGKAPLPSSLDGLAGRMALIDAEERGEEALSADEFKASILSEVGALLKRFEDDKKARDAVGIILEGGVSAFNTPRGQQVLPGLWYDYGSLTEGEDLGVLALSTSDLAAKHMKALTTAEIALRDEIEDREKQELSGRKLPQDHFHTIGQTRSALKSVSQYRQWLIDSSKTGSGASTDIAQRLGLQARSFSITVLLSRAALATNLIGGHLPAMMLRMSHGNVGFFGAFYDTSVSSLTTVLRTAARAMKIKPSAKNARMARWMADPRNLENTEKVIQMMFPHIQGIKRLNEDAHSVGLDSRVLIGKLLTSTWQARNMGGTAGKSATGLSVVGANLLAAGKGISGLTRVPLETVENFVNQQAGQIAMETELHLMTRFLRFGEERARRTGGLFDVTKPIDNFGDKELYGGGLFKNLNASNKATEVRQFFQDRLGLSLDKIGVEFYNRVQALKTEGKDFSQETLLTDDQRRQMVFAYAEIMNVPTHGNRPQYIRTSGLHRWVGLFYGYPSWAFYQQFGKLFLSRRSNAKAFRGTAESLVMAVQVALAVLVAGAIGRDLATLLNKYLWGRESAVTTDLDLISDLASGKKISLKKLNNVFWGDFAFLLGGPVGWGINFMNGIGLRSGFNPTAAVVVLNAMSDAAGTIKEAWQTNEVLLPGLRWAGRWAIPFVNINTLVPALEGSTQLRADLNLLSRGVRNSGQESRLKKTPSFSDIERTPETPLVTRFSNAIGNRDVEGAVQAIRDIADYEVKNLGKSEKDALSNALRKAQSKNPLNLVFGSKPTTDELESALATLNEKDQGRIRKLLSTYEEAIESVSKRQVKFTKEQASSSRSSSFPSFSSQSFGSSRLSRRSNYLPGRLFAPRKLRGRRSGSRLVSGRRRTRSTRLGLTPRRRLSRRKRRTYAEN